MSAQPQAIRFLGIVPQFTVPDLVRTTEFYRDVLGFQIAGYWDGGKFTPNPEGARSSRSFLGTTCRCSSTSARLPPFARVALRVPATSTFV